MLHHSGAWEEAREGGEGNRLCLASLSGLSGALIQIQWRSEGENKGEGLVSEAGHARTTVTGRVHHVGSERLNKQDETICKPSGQTL